MTIAEILQEFPHRSALVVGDICLDRWCTFDPATAEPSRETGLSRIGVVSTETTPGGGGTVANNLAALGTGRTAVLGVIGDDGFGYELSQALQARKISTGLLVRAPGVPTFTFTKLINQSSGVEDLPRVDFLNTRPLPGEIEQQILQRLHEAAPDFDVIFVSDQSETPIGGVVTAAVRTALAEIAAAHPGRIVWADSRIRAGHFRKVILKPNAREAEAACQALFGTVDYQRLRKHVQARVMFVTQGPDGVLVVDDRGETLVPTRGVDKPVDICGAGDSFSAGAGVALAITGSAVQAARFGNLVASITIMKKGTGTASPTEVLQAAAE